MLQIDWMPVRVLHRDDALTVQVVHALGKKTRLPVKIGWATPICCAYATACRPVPAKASIHAYFYTALWLPGRAATGRRVRRTAGDSAQCPGTSRTEINGWNRSQFWSNHVCGRSTTNGWRVGCSDRNRVSSPRLTG
jgi:hypothetical protein